MRNFPTSCPFKCKYTSEWKTANIVFSNVGKTHPIHTYKTQLWVGTYWESLENYPAKSYNYNYSLSYSIESTFPNFRMISDTFVVHHLNQTPLVSFTKKKQSAQASVWISNCGAKNRRLDVVRSLKKENISFASYGQCLRNAHTTDDKIETSKKHLFMFAFENSNCVDYVTEKVFHALMAGTVPVYMGTKSVLRSVPGHSMIHVDHFQTHSSLSKYLHYLANNETAYGEYFNWRQHELPHKILRKLKSARQFGSDAWKCNLCQTLHEQRGQSSHKRPFRYYSKWDRPRERSL